jgi:hypothetical protein
MPSIGQTWVLASIGAVVEMGILSTLKQLLMESCHSNLIAVVYFEPCMRDREMEKKIENTCILKLKD